MTDYDFEDVKRFLKRTDLDQLKPYDNGIGNGYQLATSFGRVILYKSSGVGPLIEIKSRDSKLITSFNMYNEPGLAGFLTEFSKTIQSTMEQRYNEDTMELKACLKGTK